MSKSIYTRVSDESHAYVKGLADESGLTLAAILNAILGEARARGWTVEPRRSLITELGRGSDGVD